MTRKKSAEAAKPTPTEPPTAEKLLERLEALECRVRDLEQENDELQFRLSHLERRT
jgi:chaperonin cofactor prefoldin